MQIQQKLATTSIALLAMTFNPGVHAQSYWHEYVLPDGGSIDCSTTSLGSGGGSTSCTRLTPKQRSEVKQEYIRNMKKVADCVTLVSAARGSQTASKDLYWVYQSCRGTYTLNGTNYMIDCDGTPTQKTVPIGWSRSLDACPGLKELVLTGKLKTRSVGYMGF